jgi:intracellular multiplication protein IcmP
MSDQKNNDPSGDILWLMIAFVGSILLIGFFFGNQLATVYLTLKLIQLKLITLVYPSEALLDWIKIIETNPVKEWKMAGIMRVGNTVGYIVNIPFIALIGWLTYKVWKKNPLQKFKRVLNMQTLKESEQRIWPYIAPVVHQTLIKEPFETGPYAMALRPYDFAIKYKLLLDERNVNSLEKSKAEKLFSSQLGKLWAGPERLKKHELALLCIMAAHGAGDKAGAMAAVNAMAISAAANPKKMPDFSTTKPLRKYLENDRVKEILNKHAYVYTIFAEMMLFARYTGVFPSSYFVWLKPKDRVLFYILNCVGRQVAFIEVAGIVGHWKAEQVAGHKLEAPLVSKAVDGLERALGEVKLV